MTLEGGAFQKASLRDDLVSLLRERRFEDALAALYKARAASPADPELQTAIDQLKDFLVTNYAKRLGGMDRVAPPLSALLPKTSSTVMLSQYIDGRSTFGDIAQVCPLGQLRTLQVMVEAYSTRSSTEADLAPPLSGLRAPSTGKVEPDVDVEPDTARSPSVPALSAYTSSSVNSLPAIAPGLDEFLIDDDAERQFKDRFSAGTAAFIQRRFQDAVSAFEECMTLRPGDKSVEVMLRRSIKDLQEQLR